MLSNPQISDANAILNTALNLLRIGCKQFWIRLTMDSCTVEIKKIAMWNNCMWKLENLSVE